jgi:hypothetical protein
LCGGFDKVGLEQQQVKGTQNAQSQTGHVEVVQLTDNSQEVRGWQVYDSQCQGQSTTLCVRHSVCEQCLLQT